MAIYIEYVSRLRRRAAPRVPRRRRQEREIKCREVEQQFRETIQGVVRKTAELACGLVKELGNPRAGELLVRGAAELAAATFDFAT